MAAQPRRRRPTPDDARREIVDAARALLLARPQHEVTVRAIMAETTLARSSFYDHFDRRASLVAELVRPVLEANRAVIDLWPAAPADPDEAVRPVVAALVATWREHGPLLLALADAAAVDEDARSAYARFSADSVGRIASKIRAEVSAGSVSGLDPDETALALVLMNRGYITARLGPEGPSDATLVRTLTEIWTRVLWPAR